LVSKTIDALHYDVFQPRNWGKPTKKPRPLREPFWGLDTERNTERNRYNDFVCGWIDNNTLSLPFKTFRDLPPGSFWVWNLGYDIEGMVRDLGKDEGWALKEDGAPFTLDGAKCVYFKNKRFEWKDGNGARTFLDASAFFNKISLKEAAKTLCICTCDGCKKHKKNPDEFQHCGEDEVKCPMKDPVDASKMSLSRYEQDKIYRGLVDKYCAKDARIAYRLMEFLRIGFIELGMKMHGEPIPIAGTPGSTSKRLLKNMPPFPKVVWATHRPFLESYCGGRFEIVKRGVFHTARQYDIISAYPWALDKCPMLTESATHNFTRRMSDDSLYGAYEIEFSSDDYLGIMPSLKGGTRVYVKDTLRGWLCKPELEFLHEQGHNYEILRGHEIFDENATNGWHEIVTPVFNMKQAHKGKPLGGGAKVGVNALYGDLIQLILKGGKWVPIEEAVDPVDFAGFLALEKGAKAYEAGQFYAPCYSATLTSMVRVRIIAGALELSNENTVAEHTDSLLAINNGRLATGEGLGDWELQDEIKSVDGDALIILKSGQYALGDKVKGRGFSKRKLDPSNEDEIAKRQKVDLWADTHMKRGRVSVRTAKSWRDVSAIQEKKVANNIGWELKRKWAHDWSAREIESRLIRGRDWMDSEALRGTKL
jgi:hypothetical protein